MGLALAAPSQALSVVVGAGAVAGQGDRGAGEDSGHGAGGTPTPGGHGIGHRLGWGLEGAHVAVKSRCRAMFIETEDAPPP